MIWAIENFNEENVPLHIDKTCIPLILGKLPFTLSVFKAAQPQVILLQSKAQFSSTNIADILNRSKGLFQVSSLELTFRYLLKSSLSLPEGSCGLVSLLSCLGGINLKKYLYQNDYF